MSKILVISGHPKLEDSHANKLILNRLENADLDVRVRYLDQLYKDGTALNITEEQDHMRAADIIVFQFPFYWYAAPAIIKQWMEDIYTFGFAFGPDGSELQGKKFLASATVGSAEGKYAPSDIKDNCMSIEIFLKPLTALAQFSGMTPLDPLYSFQMSYIAGVHENTEAVIERAENHAARLIDILKSES